MAFKVIKIEDGKTIKVSPEWKWNNSNGSLIDVSGYNLQEMSNEALFAVNKLTTLLLNREVELKNPRAIAGKLDIISCDVYLNGVNIAKYFPEFQK